MMEQEYLPLHRKYRPQKLSEMAGNKMVIDALTDVLAKPAKPHAFLFIGPSGCLRGDTKIYDPVDGTNLPVCSRWRMGKPFNVISFSEGRTVISEALPPVRYPEARMFRVETSESVFYVTHGHRFLLESGQYLSLKELNENGYADVRLWSTLESYPSTPLQGVPRYRRIIKDFLGGYPRVSRFCGEQLRALLRVVQVFAPLLNGVRVHIPYCLRWDGWWFLSIRTRFCRWCARLSKRGSYFLAFLSYPRLRFLSFAGMPGFGYGLFYTFLPARIGIFPNDKIRLLQGHQNLKGCGDQKDIAPVFFYKHPSAFYPPVAGEVVTGWAIIKTIMEVKQEEYFDFHVPVHNNYWAGGIFHHNCGKTTMARIVARELGCHERDYEEMNSANYRGIDAARDLVQSAARSPWEGEVKVYLLDECHRLTPEAQDALLKLFEEPPAHTYFMLATTNPEKLRPTIRTRCMEFPVVALRRSIVLERLQWVCVQEEKEDESFLVEDDTLSEIARLCGGSMRQALVMLDQVSEVPVGEAIAVLSEFAGGEIQVKALCRALVQGAKWKQLQGLLKGISADGENIRLAVLGYFETVMLNEPDLENIAPVVRRFTAPGMLYPTRAAITLACYEIAKEIRGSGV